MPRAARLDSPGTLHHLIIRGIEKRQIVDDDKDREIFVEKLGQLSTDLETPIYAWALMTNHAHILMRSGPGGLPAFMRKLLTGYAIAYNHRHCRNGHLFQNRYKSIVCEEDSYFKELVRYIHLNPLRAGLVDTTAKLDWYRWSGHSVLMGKRENSWQAWEYVLGWFGAAKKEARKEYRQFVIKGIGLGNQPHLEGGGLIRSAGGWSEVKALRRIGDRQASDERILGNGKFVEEIKRQVDLDRKYRLLSTDRLNNACQLIGALCKERGISVEALKNGSRLRLASKIRSEISDILIQEHGLTFSESARLLGVSASAVAKMILRKGIKR